MVLNVKGIICVPKNPWLTMSLIFSSWSFDSGIEAKVLWKFIYFSNLQFPWSLILSKILKQALILLLQWSQWTPNIFLHLNKYMFTDCFVHRQWSSTDCFVLRQRSSKLKFWFNVEFPWPHQLTNFLLVVLHKMKLECMWGIFSYLFFAAPKSPINRHF